MSHYTAQSIHCCQFYIWFTNTIIFSSYSFFHLFSVLAALSHSLARSCSSTELSMEAYLWNFFIFFLVRSFDEEKKLRLCVIDFFMLVSTLSFLSYSCNIFFLLSNWNFLFTSLITEWVSWEFFSRYTKNMKMKIMMKIIKTHIVRFCHEINIMNVKSSFLAASNGCILFVGVLLSFIYENLWSWIFITRSRK